MLQVQYESINDLKKMIALLLDKPKKKPKSSRPNASSSKPSKNKDKEKIDESSTLKILIGENNFKYEIPKSLSKKQENSENEVDRYIKRMNELENCLEAITHQSDLKEVGMVRPYPIECNAAPYHSMFKAPTLQTFDGKGSSNQHIHYFKSQTGNVVSNDAIMARLFIGTLKGVAFEWFMKLLAGSIKKWADLKKLFWVRFFEDDTEVSVPTLLIAKQKKREPITKHL